MPLTQHEQIGYDAIKTDLSGTRAHCLGSPVKWCRAAIVRDGAVVYRTGSKFSGSDAEWYPSWTRDATYVTNEKARKDAEIKTLVELERYELKSNDTIVLMGDDGPCGSCRNAIKNFVSYYGRDRKILLKALIIYTRTTYVVKNDIWPNSTFYGHGNPESDIQGIYYYRR